MLYLRNMYNPNAEEFEYRVEFWVNGQLWDVVASTSQRWLVMFAGYLCRKYMQEGAVSIVGSTHSLVEVA